MASAENHRADAFDAPPPDLADIVIRAGHLGFSRWRVATALGLSDSELAALERQISETSRDGSPWSR